MRRQQLAKARAQTARFDIAIPMRLLLINVLIAAAVILLHAIPARAAGDAASSGGIIDKERGGGMPASNPRVQPILAAHPDQNVVICVAGCDGKPKAVQILPRVVAARQGAMVTTSAKAAGPPAKAETVADSDDVVCVAGCPGKAGQVVQRMSGLPPPPKVVPKGGK